MSHLPRRDFLRVGAFGLAGGVLSLRAGAEPTPESGGLGDYGDYLKEPAAGGAPPGGDWSPTERNILGPFHREGAPFRGKVSPPLARGTVMLISGRVWGHDTRKPLARAVLDVWQASHAGRYDNDDPKAPPAKDVFLYRSRLVADDSGYYEYETIHPGRYEIGKGVWRPSHIHYLVRAPGYRTLVTQLYFKGDPENARDAFIRPSLIIDLQAVKADGGEYEKGAFDIVLSPE
ncbi:MAG: twin-arginine translocation pathway signal protein [Candidatus Brocadiae bacterium]|nr:twin-arginine translocation pathway signal protein [Candidatus Brocadiia bacterium]